MAKPAVLVTGGAKRVGGAISRRFGAAGWHVVIHYRSSGDAADDLARELPSAQTIRCDLADGEAAVAMVRELAESLEDWPVLVNCASIFEPDCFDQIDTEAGRRSMQVNAFTPALMMQAFLAHARAKGGRRVINVTDQKLENPNPDFFSYTMSKHALGSSVAMAAKAHGDPRDRVYGLAPGAILPSHDQSPEETEISHRLNLLGRKTGPDEIADAALFLASGWLASGQGLFVDSGQHLLDQDRDVIYLAREMAGA